MPKLWHCTISRPQCYSSSFNGFSKLLWRTGQTVSGMSLNSSTLSPLFVTPCDMQFRRLVWRQANDMMCRSVGGQLIQRPACQQSLTHDCLSINKKWRTCLANVILTSPSPERERQGLVHKHVSGLAAKTHCANGNTALSVWGLPLRTSLSRAVGGGESCTQDILFEPDDYLLHLIPVEITHFCPTQFEKGRFLREEVERFEMQPSPGVDRPRWRGCLLHRCSTIHIPSHASLLFFQEIANRLRSLGESNWPLELNFYYSIFE